MSIEEKENVTLLCSFVVIYNPFDMHHSRTGDSYDMKIINWETYYISEMVI